MKVHAINAIAASDPPYKMMTYQMELDNSARESHLHNYINYNMRGELK